jgi:hypothetical protein
MTAHQGVERWRAVPGFDGYYEVSDHGRVRSVERVVKGGTQRIRARIRKQSLSSGYPKVTLLREGRSSSVRIHVLVLSAFVGPRPVGAFACHDDGDRTNNRLDNLRWDTPTSNSLDTVRHGRNLNAAKSHCQQGHPFDAANTIVGVRNGRRTRTCRACATANLHAYRARKRGAA